MQSRRTPFVAATVGALCLLAGAALATEPPVLRPGDPGVTGAGLEPFHARYAETRAGTPGGERLVHLQEARYLADDGLRLVVTMLGTGGTVYDELRFRRGDLSPVLRSVSSLQLLHQIEVFGDAAVHGVRLARDGSTSEPLELTVDGPRFHGGMAALVLAGQPLAEGWAVRLPSFSSDMGPEAANVTLDVRVAGRERIDAAGRSFDAWIVESRVLDGAGEPLTLPDGSPFPLVREWVSQMPPYSIRTEFGPQLTVELVEVERTAATAAGR